MHVCGRVIGAAAHPTHTPLHTQTKRNLRTDTHTQTPPYITTPDQYVALCGMPRPGIALLFAEVYKVMKVSTLRSWFYLI